MGKVNLLPAEVVSKIAAGEVIERPASAVKELVENALDAGSQLIDVHIKNGGKTLVYVKDNGIGIEQDDLEKIFFRHATSKISKLNDLYTIRSLGFRGEALYSISSVSDVVLRSKTAGSRMGWEIHVRGGEKLSLQPVSMPDGTEIEVKELFFNTPVRKKFLKSDAVELRQILNIFIPYTLLHPSCRFKITHNKKILLDFPVEKDLVARIAKSLNLNRKYIVETYKEFSEGKNISVHLILGDINIQRARKDMQFIFINNRPVKSYELSGLLNRVYKLVFPQGIYPFFAVFVNIPPENVDVNIHPTKREVKMKNSTFLTSALRSLCEETLLSYGKAKQVMGKKLYREKQKSSRDGFSELAIPQPIKDFSAGQYKSEGKKSVSGEEENLFFEKGDNLKNKLTNAYFIGSFMNKYLLFETDDSLFVIDQHAAHERITYERFKKQIESGKVEIQQLLMPVLIRLSHQEFIVWEDGKKKMEEIGFTTTLWDKENIACHTHPQLISHPEMAIRNLLSEKNIPKCDSDTLARRACRESVMAGQLVKKEEAEFLKDELMKCDDPFICPHGRPTVVEIKEKFLNKQFLRE